MNERERSTELEEVVVFENSGEVLIEFDEIKNIMDVSGTPHEKLLKLAEML